jgi:hypothetical protein
MVRHAEGAEQLGAAGNADQGLHDEKDIPPEWQKYEARRGAVRKIRSVSRLL